MPCPLSCSWLTKVILSDFLVQPTLCFGKDVVPVDPATVASWDHPPFSGAYEDGYIWGRGSCDDKSDLIGLLLSVESLLEAGFKPRRTFVMAFGFDEEVSGREVRCLLAIFVYLI